MQKKEREIQITDATERTHTKIIRKSLTEIHYIETPHTENEKSQQEKKRAKGKCVYNKLRRTNCVQYIERKFEYIPVDLTLFTWT